jgi:putative phosphoribosyl transferase
MQKRFTNRTEAGQQLAFQLQMYKGKEVVVLGIPRGGIPVAAEIASFLQCELQVLLCKKIRHPHQKEYAIGAVTLSEQYIVPHENISPEYLQKEIKNLRQKLINLQLQWSIPSSLNITHKIVIITDDGMATGRTMMAALRLVRKYHPLKIILAIPVASASAVQYIQPETDELICLHTPEWFTGVGAFYDDFREVTEEEVATILRQSKKQLHE